MQSPGKDCIIATMDSEDEEAAAVVGHCRRVYKRAQPDSEDEEAAAVACHRRRVPAKAYHDSEDEEAAAVVGNCGRIYKRAQPDSEDEEAAAVACHRRRVTHTVQPDSEDEEAAAVVAGGRSIGGYYVEEEEEDGEEDSYASGDHETGAAVDSAKNTTGLSISRDTITEERGDNKVWLHNVFDMILLCSHFFIFYISFHLTSLVVVVLQK
jgi:catalase (peroxidase I)